MIDDIVGDHGNVLKADGFDEAIIGVAYDVSMDTGFDFSNYKKGQYLVAHEDCIKSSRCLKRYIRSHSMHPKH